MVLTDEEVIKLWDSHTVPVFGKSGINPIVFAQLVESAVLEKLKAQEPDAWRVFDGEGGYDYRSYVDNEKYQAEFLARNPSSTYKNWVEPLYLHPLPPDDVVQKYDELLYSVHKKFPDETRHQTALRYIKTAESPSYTNAAMKERK